MRTHAQNPGIRDTQTEPTHLGHTHAHRAWASGTHACAIQAPVIQDAHTCADKWNAGIPDVCLYVCVSTHVPVSRMSVFHVSAHVCESQTPGVWIPHTSVPDAWLSTRACPRCPGSVRVVCLGTWVLFVCPGYPGAVCMCTSQTLGSCIRDTQTHNPGVRDTCIQNPSAWDTSHRTQVSRTHTRARRTQVSGTHARTQNPGMCPCMHVPDTQVLCACMCPGHWGSVCVCACWMQNPSIWDTHAHSTWISGTHASKSPAVQHTRADTCTNPHV